MVVESRISSNDADLCLVDVPLFGQLFLGQHADDFGGMNNALCSLLLVVVEQRATRGSEREEERRRRSNI